MAIFKSDFAIEEYMAKRISERIAIHFRRGNFEAARRAVDYAETLTQAHPNAPLNDMPIAQTPISERTLNLLERNGVVFIGDLVGKGEDWVLSLSGGGEGALREIRKILIAEVAKRREK